MQKLRKIYGAFTYIGGRWVLPLGLIYQMAIMGRWSVLRKMGFPENTTTLMYDIASILIDCIPYVLGGIGIFIFVFTIANMKEELIKAGICKPSKSTKYHKTKTELYNEVRDLITEIEKLDTEDGTVDEERK